MGTHNEVQEVMEEGEGGQVRGDRLRVIGYGGQVTGKKAEGRSQKATIEFRRQKAEGRIRKTEDGRIASRQPSAVWFQKPWATGRCC